MSKTFVGEEMRAYHDILPYNRICPRLSELFDVRINELSAVTCIEPVAPDFRSEHLGDEILEQFFEA